MRTMMPRHAYGKYDPWVWQWPETPDGFAEVTIEINGQIIGTTVSRPDMTHEQSAAMLDRLSGMLLARC